MPADRETLLQLAERCERATEGSRELNSEIWCALHGHAFIELSPPNYIVIWPAGEPREPWLRRHVAMPPNYTRSLDAALALRPAGWWVDLRITRDEHGGVTLQNDMGGFATADAATPALALCAAALRARAQETPR